MLKFSETVKVENKLYCNLQKSTVSVLPATYYISIQFYSVYFIALGYNMKLIQNNKHVTVHKQCILFSEGGTISNLYSILVARYHFYPEVKTRGMAALPQLALFTSEHVNLTHLLLHSGFLPQLDL